MAGVSEADIAECLSSPSERIMLDEHASNQKQQCSASPGGLSMLELVEIAKSEADGGLMGENQN